jgi:hypothetical protein
MSSPEERIREIARAQSIDAAAAERLLAAVRPAAAKPAAALRNPFERWSGETTSLVGLVVAAAAVATSRLGVRYNGALDLHFVHGAVPFTTALSDQLVAVPVTALVLWGAARLVSRARFVDVLGAVALSRAPAVELAAPLALLVPYMPVDPTKPNAVVLGIALVSLVGLALQIVLLVLGFRTATGTRGSRLAGSLVAGLVAAEIVSKSVLFLVSLVSR